MLREHPDQTNKPSPVRRWPKVANRHRKAAMEEATAIRHLVNADFLDLLENEVDHEVEEAIMSVRHNPGKALRHMQNARLMLRAVIRSAQLIRGKAETIYMVLDNAPADGSVGPADADSSGAPTDFEASAERPAGPDQ